MKRRLRFIAVAIVVSLPTLAFILIALNFTWFSYSRSLKALQAKGEKVTFQELAKSLTPLTNSTLTGFSNAVWKLGDPPANMVNHLEDYVAPGRVQVLQRLDRMPAASRQGRNGPTTWADLQQLLNSRKAHLDELRKSLKQPDLNAGPWTDYMEPRTNWMMVKTGVYWLICNTVGDLRDDDKAATMTDIETLGRLSELHREEYPIVAQLTRIAAGGAGLQATWQVLQSKSWDDSQLKALQETWNRLDFFEALEHGLIGERSFSSELWRTKLGIITPPDAPEELKAKRTTNARWYAATIMNLDLRYRLRLDQAYVEQARALRDGHPWPEVSKSVSEINRELNAMIHSPRKFLYLVTLTSIPNWYPAFQTAVRTETKRRMTVTAIALRRYELKYHKNAPDLNALVPEFLPGVPIDCMDGRPIKYRTKSDGTFVLYSVGEDGQDNGGDASWNSLKTQPTIWDARDAVWPSPAE